MSVLDLRGARVSIDPDVHTIYDEFVSSSTRNVEDRPFATMKDLFVVAACIGAQRNRYEVLRSRTGIFSGEVFSPRVDVPVLAALAYKRTADLEALSDPRRVIDIAQEWANAGIHILKREEMVMRGGLRPLFKLVDLVLEQSRTE